MNKEHGVYKFVEKESGRIVYIGKSNSSIDNRIIAHLSGRGLDEKFRKYKGKCDIFTAILPNSVETDLIERALINEFKPELNVVDNLPGTSNLIKVDNIEWKAWQIPTKQKPKEEKKQIETDHSWFEKGKAFLKTIKSAEDDGFLLLKWPLPRTYALFIYNKIRRKIKGKWHTTQIFENDDEAFKYIYVLYCVMYKYGKLYRSEYSTRELIKISAKNFFRSEILRKYGIYMMQIYASIRWLDGSREHFNLIESLQGTKDDHNNDIIQSIYVYKDAIDLLAMLLGIIPWDPEIVEKYGVESIIFRRMQEGNI